MSDANGYGYIEIVKDKVRVVTGHDNGKDIEYFFDADWIIQDHKVQEAVENRLSMAKTLKDEYMIQLFTDILRGH